MSCTMDYVSYRSFSTQLHSVPIPPRSPHMTFLEIPGIKLPLSTTYFRSHNSSSVPYSTFLISTAAMKITILLTHMVQIASFVATTVAYPDASNVDLSSLYIGP